MTLKLLHLNILYGRYIDQLIDYLKHEDFDILCFQEVGSGRVSAHGTDNFDEIRTRLGYHGEKIVSWNLAGDKNSNESNAIFFKPVFTVVKRHAEWLKKSPEPTEYETRNFQDDPRTALYLELQKEDKRIRIITTHLSWGRTSDDDPNKLEPGKKLFEFVKTIEKPYILTGDFNVNPDSQIVKMIDSEARNLTTENHITNTLNPRTHKAPRLFPSGIAVDYIYVTEGVTVKGFKALSDLNISDHLGLSIEFEI
ncbi:MAG: endonuclease/exonuclease/phosphatase family protein [Candidatus Levybacteria bacterium]|nr:endonuclease/exonuclease/phosphatase family protein [Candidatus Levybacteria bacterium]